MKALILNSGLGSRMGVLTANQPKCMTEITAGETILGRQLGYLQRAGVDDIVITTGYYNTVLEDYCKSLDLPVSITFINNPLYKETNYIYSIFCAREVVKEQDIILMHGDIVFDYSVLEEMLAKPCSCMKVSSTEPLPGKDFKAVVVNGKVKAVGVEFFESAMEAQALYKLNRNEWQQWLDKICEYCESGETNCYAEKALNEITDRCSIEIFDAKDRLCTEVDDVQDLERVRERIGR